MVQATLSKLRRQHDEEGTLGPKPCPASIRRTTAPPILSQTKFFYLMIPKKYIKADYGS
jgi:hypothetical protein